MSNFEEKADQFREFYAANLTRMQGAAEAFRSLVELLLSDRTEIATPTVTCRVKDREECVTKFKRKYLAKLEESGEDYAILDSLTDLIGVRVVALYEDEIEAIREIVVEQFEVVEITDKTASLEETEGTFGYKGLHMDLQLDDKRRGLPEYEAVAGFCFEVQLRTIIQDGWSNLDHKIKYKKQIPHDLRRRINSLAALFEIADREFREIRDRTDELVADAVITAPGADRGGLTAFNLGAVAKRLFPEYPFWDKSLDAFAQELTRLSTRLTPSDIERGFVEHRRALEAYSDHQNSKSHRPNPFTMLRYGVFLLDRERHQKILRKSQRTALEKWMKGRP